MTLSRGSKLSNRSTHSLSRLGNNFLVFARGVFAFKKVLQSVFFGSLTLSDEIARGDAREPWAALRAAPTSRKFEPFYKTTRTYFIKNS